MLEKQQLLGELPDDPRAATKIIEQFSDEVFGNLYIHRCWISSCGKPPGGKCGCRFALPRAAGEYYNETGPYFFVARKGTGNRYTIEVYKSKEEFDRLEEFVACVLVVWELNDRIREMGVLLRLTSYGLSIREQHQRTTSRP